MGSSLCSDTCFSYDQVSLSFFSCKGKCSEKLIMETETWTTWRKLMPLRGRCRNTNSKSTTPWICIIRISCRRGFIILDIKCQSYSAKWLSEKRSSNQVLTSSQSKQTQIWSIFSAAWRICIWLWHQREITKLSVFIMWQSRENSTGNDWAVEQSNGKSKCSLTVKQHWAAV